MRSGRPRKLGKRCHPNGSCMRVRDTTTTPEILLKRAMLAGPGGEVVKTSSPIDLMELHGVIDRGTAQAAHWFA